MFVFLSERAHDGHTVPLVRKHYFQPDLEQCEEPTSPCAFLRLLNAKKMLFYSHSARIRTQYQLEISSTRGIYLRVNSVASTSPQLCQRKQYKKT